METIGTPFLWLVFGLVVVAALALKLGWDTVAMVRGA